MRFEGRVFKKGRYWAIEVPILGVVTQGRSRKDAYAMIADAIQSLVHKRSFRVHVFLGEEEYFEIGASNEAALLALLLRRQRTMQGLSLADVARRLGARSLNTYARYEQGRSVPSVERFGKLLAAVSSGSDYVLRPSRGDRAA